MKILSVSSFLAASLLSSTSTAQDFAAFADGLSVVPTTTSTANAVISATLHATPTGPELDYSILLDGLDLDGNQTPDPFDNVTAVHFHRGLAGFNGPHVLNVFGIPSEDDAQLIADPVAGTLVGTWNDIDEKFNPMMPPASTLTTTEGLAELLSCGVYVQIHTAAVPAGEIRGQLVPSFRFDLSGNSVVPAVTSLASGDAELTLRATASGPELDYVITLDGLDLDGNQTVTPLDDVTGVHFHVAADGTNGAHVLNVFGTPSLDDAQMVFDAAAGTISGTWDDLDEMVNPLAPLNKSSIALSNAVENLLDGLLYIEIETAGNPDGELRGQMLSGVPFPGTSEDFRLATGVNAAATTGPCASAKRAGAGDVLTVELTSPGSQLATGVPLVFAELYPSHLLPTNTSLPGFPAFQLEPSSAALLFNGLEDGGFGSPVIGGGVTLNYVILPGLAGFTVRLQGVALSTFAEDGVVAFSEAHDIVFE